jgi:hypothetical protein
VKTSDQKCVSRVPAVVIRAAAWTAAVGLCTASGRANLTIVPTWDSTITSDPNAAAIEASINSAIAVYSADFTDNVTETITFKEMSSGLGESEWYYYTQSYSGYLSALNSHKTTATDTAVLAHLPSGSANPVNSSTSINLQDPLARALGFSAPTPGGATDGTVLLNTSIMNLSAPFTQNSGRYSLFSTVSHEIDECLGIASALSGLSNGAAAPTGAIFPEDLFRYDSSGNRSFNTTATTAAYFSVDGTTDLARYNQEQGGDFNDWYSYFGGVTPQVQDAYATPGKSPTLGVELTVLDALGYTPAVTTPASLTWDPSPTAGLQDGPGVWNTSAAVFSNGTTNFAWTNGTSLNATFGVGSGAAGTVTLGTNISAQTITFNAAGSGNYTIAGGGFTLSMPASATITANAAATISAPISAAGTLTKNGISTLTLSGNTTTGGTFTVAAGTLSLTGGTLTTPSLLVQSGAAFNLSTGTLAATSPLSVSAGGVAIFANHSSAGIQTRTLAAVTLSGNADLYVQPAAVHANRQSIITAGLTLGGSAAAWQSLIDLANNDLDIQAGSLSAATSQVAQGYAFGQWNAAAGIVSSTAAGDPSHLTALGVIQNNQSGSPLFTAANPFDNATPGVSDILIKYTYYGDANLDGKIDGSDYSLLDAGYASHGARTGWYNGDFNYDGAIDGSDYTLIDNAFNNQTLNLSTAAIVAASTAQPAAVPEPASAGLLAVAAVGLAARRRRNFDTLR